MSERQGESKVEIEIETEIASGRNGTRLRNIIENSTKKISSAYKTSKCDREVMYVDNESKLKIKSKRKKKEKRKEIKSDQE